MRTVLLSFVLSNAICAAVMVSLWVTNRKRYAGLGLWMGGYTGLLASVCLQVLRGILPGWLPTLLGDPLAVGGVLLLYMGLERYTGRTGRPWRNHLLLAVFAGVHVCFTFAWPSLLARDLSLSLTLFTLAAQSVWLLVRRADREMRRNARPVALVFTAVMLLSLAGAGAELAAPPKDLFAAGNVVAVTILAYQMLLVGLTFSLSLMVVRGLFAELDRDIAQRRRAEESLHEAREAADRANRAKSEFLARLSHELRTPLTPVLIAVGQWEADVPAAMREDLAMVRRNLDLEARLLDDLLDVNRIVHGKMPLRRELVDLHERVSTALEIVRTDAQAKQLTMTVELKADRCQIDGDPARLLQAIWNPLRNAIKFTPHGGRITVSTENDPAGRVRVSIADDGIGIAPERVPTLFQPFEQGDQGDGTSAGSGGLGLGLTICKSLVEMHGGSVTAHSEGVGRGAVFTIQLPTVTPSTAGRANHAPGRQGRPAMPAARVLLVEDHPDTARLLTRVLRSWGHQVRAAHSIADALVAAEAEPFDLLVSDLGLPDGTGHDLMRSLSATRTIKAIAVSGYGMDEDQQRSRDAGFAMHLTKPVDLQEFRAAIAAVLEAEAEA